jgi:hypothetical protein
LARDPAARQLYKDHHDVQDVLDDFGNRLPLIDWNAFDAQLARRLALEDARARHGWRFGRVLRPLSAAAALALAALVGYTWHGWTPPAGAGGTLAVQPAAHVPVASATLEQPPSRSSLAEVSIPDAPVASTTATARASIAPATASALPQNDLAEARRPDQPRVALDTPRRDHANGAAGTITGGSVTPARSDAEQYP